MVRIKKPEIKLIELQKIVGGKLWTSKRKVPILTVENKNISWFGIREVYRIFNPAFSDEQTKVDLGTIKAVKRYLKRPLLFDKFVVV